MTTAALPKNIRLNLADYAPAEVMTAPAMDKRAAVARLAELALHLKRLDVVRGIGADGKKFAPVKHPRPDGATGSPLSPHGMASRTAALLAAHQGTDFVTLFWRAQGRKSWSTILAYHALGMVKGAAVRDEFGISPVRQRQIKSTMALWWKTRAKYQAKGLKPPPIATKPPAKPTPPPPQPVMTKRGQVVYLAKGQKPDPLSKKVQVFEVPDRKPKGPAAPKVKPTPKPKPTPVVAVKATTPPPPVVPKPTPVITAVVPPPRVPLVHTPPPSPVMRVAEPPDFHQQMLPRVDAEIKKLGAQYVAAKPAFDAADARYQAVKLTHGKDSPEGRAAKQVAQVAFAKLEEVVTTGKRFEAWKRDVKTNPNLIPPFEAQERLAIYSQRGGAEKLAKLQALAKAPDQDAARIEQLEGTLRQYQQQFRATPPDSPMREQIRRDHEQAKEERARLLGRPLAARPTVAQVAEVLAVGKPLEIKPDLAPRGFIAADVEIVSERQLPVIADAMAYLRKVFSHAGMKEIAVPIGRIPKGSKDRSFCNKMGVAIEERAETEVLIHEIGHHLETHTGIGHAAQGFLKYRVGDEQPQRMADLFPGIGYGPSEMGRKDRFDELFGTRSGYYVGKDYGSTGTEITSMGLQKFFNDPVDMASKDPEYTSFLLGILDGSLR